jgi:hypothetical protein
MSPMRNAPRSARPDHQWQQSRGNRPVAALGAEAGVGHFRSLGFLRSGPIAEERCRDESPRRRVALDGVFGAQVGLR